jgi:hypothetical protein
MLVLICFNINFAQSSQNFRFYHPPFSSSKWNLDNNTYSQGTKTIIPCVVVRSGIKVKSGNDSVDVATLAFSRGVEAWNKALESAKIPLQLALKDTAQADENFYQTGSFQNTFELTNTDADGAVPSLVDSVPHGRIQNISTNDILIGNQIFKQSRVTHILLNLYYYKEKGWLTLGKSVPLQNIFNICYVATHELGHFLGINTHEVSLSSVMLPGGMPIPSQYSNCDCDNVKVVLSVADIKLLKMLYPEFQLQTTHQNDSCLPRSNEP